MPSRDQIDANTPGGLLGRTSLDQYLADRPSQTPSFSAAWQAEAATRAYLTLPTYTTIATFGDSITAGNSVVTQANRWSDRLATAVGATLTNKGISGTLLQNGVMADGLPNTDNGRDRFVADLLGAAKRDAVFIIYGLNDARFKGAPTTINATLYKNDLREVIQGLLLGGYTRSTIYLASHYYITDIGLNTTASDPNFAGQSRSVHVAHAAAAREVAAEFGVNFCDMYAELANPAFIANVDANDHIHPTDTAHGYIFAAWMGRTVASTAINPKPAPLSVSAAGGAGQIICSCVSLGAASYEFVAVNRDYVDRAIATDADGAGATLTGLSAGSYRVKARAVFSDGSKGPWTFSGSWVTVTETGVFLFDSFSDSAAATLTAHAPEIGGAWSVQTGDAAFATSASLIDGANRLYGSGSTGVYQNAAVPPSADYYVEADLVYLSSIASQTEGVAARMAASEATLYFARYQEGTGWQLVKTNAGASTLLATQTSPAFVPKQTKRLRLEVSGAVDPVLTVKVDGATIIQFTDNSGTRVTATGKAGIRGTAAKTATTGIHVDNVKAGAL